MVLSLHSLLIILSLSILLFLILHKKPIQENFMYQFQSPNVYFKSLPPQVITWTPYSIDYYNQPAYHAYFFDNHYMYPLY